MTSEEEKSIVNGHCNHLALKFSVCLRNAKTDFLRCIGYLSFTKDRMKHDLLQTRGSLLLLVLAVRIYPLVQLFC